MRRVYSTDVSTGQAGSNVQLHVFAPFSLDNGDDGRIYSDEAQGTFAARAHYRRCNRTERSIRAFVVISDDDAQQQQEQQQQAEREERRKGKSIATLHPTAIVARPTPGGTARSL